MSGSRVTIQIPARPGVETPEAACLEPLVHLTSANGRDALLAWAAESLPAGECLVEIRDLASRRRSFETVPADPRARLVAEAAPTKLRGTLVARVRYYRVPTDALTGIETHRENGEFSHQYEVKMRPVVTGARAARVPLVAA